MANHDNDLIEDGPAPETVEQSDGRVTLRGDEIPDDVTIVEENIVNEEAPKTEELETPEEETPATDGTGEDSITLSEAEKIFTQNENLVKRFGTLDNMISSQSETDKYIARLEQERKQLKDIVQPKKEPEVTPLTPDEFFNDPITAVNKILDSRTKTYDEKIQEIEFNNFVQSKPDFNDMRPQMENQLELNPELKSIGLKALPILYNLAKADQFAKSKAANPNPQPTTVPNKVKAETSPGKTKAAPLDKNSLEYWRDKSPEDIRNEVGYAPGQDNISM